MKIAIHQPEYLPYLGFFDRISKADVFIILDTVQYQKNAFINRNKIKTPKGWQWITVPIKNREALKSINETEIENKTDWKQTHWKSLLYNYKRAPNFRKYADFFEDAYKKEWNLISDLNIYFIKNIMEMLGMKKEIKIASSMNLAGSRDDLLIYICNSMGADAYLSGPGGKEYMDLEKYGKENIKVEFHEFTPPIYNQQFGEFIPNLSTVDFLFNNAKIN